MLLIAKGSWGKTGKRKEQKRFVDSIWFQMYQKWDIHGTSGEKHLTEIGNECARYDQLVFSTHSSHLSLSLLGLQRMESQKSTFQTPLHFRLWMQIRFHQWDVVAKDLEGVNETKAISWDFLNVFCYHARYWTTDIQVPAASVNTDTALVIVKRSVFWCWRNCASKTFTTPGSQMRQGVSKFLI